MADDVRVESGPMGPVVHPPDPDEAVVLHLEADRRPKGAPDPALDLARRLARRTRATVVCARCRPVFPAALEDAQEAYGYSRAWGPVVVTGRRTGAGLAAALLVRLRDLGAEPPRGAVLVSALLDLTLQAPSLLFNSAADPAFDVTELRRQAARYAAGRPLTDPLLSPLYANLHGLPPIQLLVAGTDPLLDDSLSLAARAARSGVAVDLHVRPDTAALNAELIPVMADFIAAQAP
ncbi:MULTISPECIES: alpha/beta hydrolase fold domain-containing protein [Thermomonospora]|jgi:monoterpene epsilon-lactone hydrolase|uniref:Alpha/beta hydrolase fold-3 domain protein n=1 Tax=Thermomonospora curvata (strain ATCC 19995 / DSM 43183 / JCM 3096 / KCTC 9072 / NBRC 15933 / NCIMB 10081 / Henssen B9) TaxID=471852 RepID=D1A5Z4_THECD|nr:MULTISPECIES: alpha/beta hydrolase fold domain-containing protein [Thermomonospora]ACY98289.1 Alpha/beta hydrolase fold-3 domain protein [Thermomonospora curvata DSM 43183]PKK13458.1 MAG: alpha/beta hydrolase [Thermomonospora sp. CIF 1]